MVVLNNKAFVSNVFVLIILNLLSTSFAKEVLPDKCHCRDWYGGCRKSGDSWTDDGSWTYRCSSNDGAPASFTGCQAKVPGNKGQTQERMIPVDNNQTVNGFWYSCEMNEIRIKYAQEPRCVVNGTDHHVGEFFREGTWEWLCLETGRWVYGCYYQNETSDWVKLKIGEVQYNGLIRHTCDRYQDNPGRVQYHAEIRDDIPYKNPSNKGTNKNFPDLIDNRLKAEPIPWTHKNVESFIANVDAPNAKIRYLPQSNAIHQPPSFTA